MRKEVFANNTMPFFAKTIHLQINTQYSIEYTVAPHVGAWIETYSELKTLLEKASHPTWVRGLKLRVVCDHHTTFEVAPHVGAWIETWRLPDLAEPCQGRTPRGCVD